jgi:hypothetical protein
MTCEVALLNRHAVALAADSATTVTYWEQGARKERYFKGTNKLFNLSAAHPVALMTSDSGNMQGVPWEVLVKAYRDAAGDRAHDSITGYAPDLFKYIETNKHLYPADFQERQLLSDLVDVAAVLVAIVARNKDVAAALKDKDQKRVRIAGKKAFSELIKKIQSSDFIDNATGQIAQRIKSKYSVKLLKLIKQRKFIVDREDMVPFKDLAQWAPLSFIKKSYTTLDTTDIVVAGFGDKEYFPHVKSYTVYGLVLGKILYAEGNDTIINQENTAEIVPIARSSMIKNFMYGIAPSVLNHIGSSVSKALDEFQDALVQDGKLAATADVDAFKTKASDNFGNTLSDELVKSHSTPLRRVVGLLPLDELADLAEILVSIESLKERVTTTTETVSGPIDVAVISKGDGFIWIKRKHYFDPKFNPRYFQRRGVKHDG